MTDDPGAVPAAELISASRLSGLGHWSFLLLSIAMLVSACLLHVVDGRRVALPVSGPLPEVCSFKRYTGHACPGCGLTRCFISIVRGDMRAAWHYNPAGIALFAVVVLQVPYRAALLWRIHRGHRVTYQPALGSWTLIGLAFLLLLQWVVRWFI